MRRALSLLTARGPIFAAAIPPGSMSRDVQAGTPPSWASTVLLRRVICSSKTLSVSCSVPDLIVKMFRLERSLGAGRDHNVEREIDEGGLGESIR